MMAYLYPSLISSDLLALNATIKTLEPYCAGFHVDVMDNHFVPNLTLGPDFVNSIRKAATKRLWVHLMVEKPKTIVDRLHLHHGDIVSIHYETVTDHEMVKIVRELHQRKILFSLAINPTTAVEVIKPYIHENMLDQVLLMSVNPGFSGQSFLPDSSHRLQALYDLREEHALNFAIGMDGGITTENLPKLIKEGVDDVAVASAIFQNENPLENIKKLNELLEKV